MNKRKCDGNCNACLFNQKSIASYQILQLICERDESIMKEVNTICPNMSVCPECHVDDFVHVEGCSFVLSEVSE